MSWQVTFAKKQCYEPNFVVSTLRALVRPVSITPSTLPMLFLGRLFVDHELGSFTGG